MAEISNPALVTHFIKTYFCAKLRANIDNLDNFILQNCKIAAMALNFYLAKNRIVCAKTLKFEVLQ